MANFPAGCALIFGGSGGIGSGVARTFAEAGSDIAVVWRSRSGPAEAAAAYALSLGRKASTHQADVTRPDEMRAAIDEAIGQHGRIHSGNAFHLCELCMKTLSILLERVDASPDESPIWLTNSRTHVKSSGALYSLTTTVLVLHHSRTVSQKSS